MAKEQSCVTENIKDLRNFWNLWDAVSLPDTPETLTDKSQKASKTGWTLLRICLTPKHHTIPQMNDSLGDFMWPEVLDEPILNVLKNLKDGTYNLNHWRAFLQSLPDSKLMDIADAIRRGHPRFEEKHREALNLAMIAHGQRPIDWSLSESRLISKIPGLSIGWPPLQDATQTIPYVLCRVLVDGFPVGQLTLIHEYYKNFCKAAKDKGIEIFVEK